jgi:ABC-type oligopeptide transport system substrate-binding subunit
VFALETKPGAPFDLASQGWIPDHPDPAAMLNPILQESSAGPTFNDRGYQRKLAAAARRSGPERYLTYGKLGLDLARHGAPLAALPTNPATTSSPPGSAVRSTSPAAWISPRSA